MYLDTIFPPYVYVLQDSLAVWTTGLDCMSSSAVLGYYTLGEPAECIYIFVYLVLPLYLWHWVETQVMGQAHD